MNFIRKTVGRLLFIATLPAICLFASKRERVRVMLVNDNNETLLIKCSIGLQEWEFPGGGVKSSESLRQAAVRELREEVGIEVDERALIDLGQTKTRHRLAPFYIRTFRIQYTDAATVRKHSLEVSELQWFPLSSLPYDRNNNYSEIVSYSAKL